MSIMYRTRGCAKARITFPNGNHQVEEYEWSSRLVNRPQELKKEHGLPVHIVTAQAPAPATFSGILYEVLREDWLTHHARVKWKGRQIELTESARGPNGRQTGKKLLKKRAEALLLELKTGKTPQAAMGRAVQRGTVGSLLQDFIDSGTPKKDVCDRITRTLLPNPLSKVRLDEITKQRINEWLSERGRDTTHQYKQSCEALRKKLTAQGKSKEEIEKAIAKLPVKTVRETTIERERGILVQAVSWARTTTRYADLPDFMKDTKKLKQHKERERIFSSDEYQTFLHALEKYRGHKKPNYPYYALLLKLELGLRRKELLQGLRQSQINLSERVFTLLGDYAKGLNRNQGGKTRYVPLSDIAVDLIKEWLTVRPKAFRNEDRLFPINTHTYSSFTGRFFQRIGIHDYTEHDIRAETITRLLSNGVFAPAEVQKIVGHAVGSKVTGAYFRQEAIEMAKKQSIANRTLRLELDDVALSQLILAADRDGVSREEKAAELLRAALASDERNENRVQAAEG